MEISKQQYEEALKSIEKLLPKVEDKLPLSPEAKELMIMSEIVYHYENEHFPILKPLN